MEEDVIGQTIQLLTDLELACLVCLIAEQHCIVRAPEHLLGEVQAELESVASLTFGLSYATLDCGPLTTVERFCDAVVDNSQSEELASETPGSKTASTVAFSSSRRPSLYATNVLDSRKVANLVIAKNLDQASHNVQIQALEDILSYCRPRCPETVLVRMLDIPVGAWAAVLDTTSCKIVDFAQKPRQNQLTHFENDTFFISHNHSQPSKEGEGPEIPGADSASTSSFSSVLRTRSASPKRLLRPGYHSFIDDATLTRLQKLTTGVRMTAEVRRYTHNIITFLRLHRAVAGGVSAVSARHLYLMTSILAPLHSQSYITPSLVPLAALKVLPHRVELVEDPSAERSMQWGSTYNAVAAMLREAHASKGAVGVLEDVLREVPVPL